MGAVLDIYAVAALKRAAVAQDKVCVIRDRDSLVERYVAVEHIIVAAAPFRYSVRKGNRIPSGLLRRTESTCRIVGIRRPCPIDEGDAAICRAYSEWYDRE